MKKAFRLKALAVTVACSVAFGMAFAFTGCSNKSGDNGNAQGNAQGSVQTVVGYTAKESAVYNTTADVVAAVADTVVEIITESVTTQWGMQYVVSGAGSGVITGVSDDTYYIITNHHVIDGAKDITVRTRSGSEYEANLVASDDSADIAVVTVTSQTELKIATWGDSDQLKIGEDLIAIGNPLGSLGGTVTKGILSATGRSIVVGDYAMTLLQTDTAINPGNSGGGLFNMRGQLIGVVNAKTSDEEIEGICFAIPANTAKSVYDSLIENGYLLGRAVLPVTVSAGSISSGGMNAQSQSIVYVTAVGEGVADGTFKLYDRIHSINGKEVSTVAGYNSALAGIKPNEEVTVKVYRGTVSQGFFGNSISFSSELTEFKVTALQYGA